MTSYTVSVIRSKRKSLILTISGNSTVIVKAPRFMPQFLITQFIKKHEEWIQKHLNKIQYSPKNQIKRYTNGETFLFLGVKHVLSIGNFKQISVEKNTIFFPEFMHFRAQKQLQSWYKKQARDLITKQVEYFAAQMNAQYSGLTFSDTRSQWGSCSPENKLQFSWRLVMTPILVINYVVVHELAHTIQKNHSQKFWQIVAQYIPSYRIHRNWLKKHGDTLIV